MTQYLLLASGLAGAVLLVGAYALAGRWEGVAAAAVLGLLWWINHWWRRAGIACMAFLGCLTLAAVGLWLDLPALAMLVAAILTLCAWDLDHYCQRVARAGRVADGQLMERRHLGRLGVTAGLGLTLGGAALHIEIPLTFLTAVLLGFLVIFGLQRAIGLLRREMPCPAGRHEG